MARSSDSGPTEKMKWKRSKAGIRAGGAKSNNYTKTFSPPTRCSPPYSEKPQFLFTDQRYFR